MGGKGTIELLQYLVVDGPILTGSRSRRLNKADWCRPRNGHRYEALFQVRNGSATGVDDSKLVLDAVNSMTTHNKTGRADFLACLLAVTMTSFSLTASAAETVTPQVAGQLNGLSFVETVTAGADEKSELPMVIALHYMTGSPATSIEDYGGVDAPVRLLSLQGPHELDGGYSWFPDGYYELDAGSQLEVTVDVSDRVASFIRAAIQAFPTQGKPILTGYSQGADLTHMIALREPGLIFAGLPMGGRFPDAWLDAVPEDAKLPARIALFHGAADEAVDVNESLAAATYYTANGVSVVLHTYAGVGHSYPAQMKQDFQAVIAQLIEAMDD